MEAEPNRFLRFPTKFEIHEYKIIADFAEALPEGKMQKELFDAIRGKGAFRKFKNVIQYFGIEQLWYDYQENAYRESMIVKGCEKMGQAVLSSRDGCSCHPRCGTIRR